MDESTTLMFEVQKKIFSRISFSMLNVCPATIFINFSDLQLQPPEVLQPLEPQKYTVSHLKVLPIFEWNSINARA